MSIQHPSVAAVPSMVSLLSILDALERLDTGVAIFDHDGRYVFLNGAAERMLGRSRADLLGRRFADATPGHAGDPFERAFERALSDGGTHRLVAERLPAGRLVEIEVAAGGDHVIALWKDLTPRRDADCDAALDREQDAPDAMLLQ